MIIKQFYIYFLFFCVYSNYLAGQILSFQPSILVNYSSTLRLGENFVKNQDFVLLGNTTDYYFAGEHNYLLDLKDQNDISNVYLGSNDYFLERIIKKGSDFSVLYRFADTKIRYTENVKLNWKLYPETKIILGIKCQLAITYAYGRRWIAYFSKDYPNHIGPYKFSGLPGLILDLQDDAGDYKFVATKIEKNNKRFAYNASGYRKFSKKDYLKAKYNIDYEGAAYPPMSAGMKKEYDEMSAANKIRFNNPIELKPL